MVCRLSELCDKEIVNMKDGAILGTIGDLDIETADAKILAMVIPGKPKCFGLLGREEDTVICWQDIQLIGEDTVLVRYCPPQAEPRKGLFSFLGF